MEEIQVKHEIGKSRARKAMRRTMFRPNDGLTIAFFVPVVIMILIFIQRGIFPFGDQSFLRTDMYHQYAPFFSEFREKLQNGGSLFYSWDLGMGVNFAALYAYYLASPFNWLVILCPQKFVIEFMTYMIVLKTGLCGLSFAWYLKKKCQTDSIGIGFFGIFYALSGYMAAYSWNIMWLDCIILFPLIVWGLERLVKKEDGIRYCVTLGLSILSNYYISIMICIFMVIYFVALLILEKSDAVEEWVTCAFRFAIYSLLAGALAAFVLLPEVAILQTTASGYASFPKTLSSYFSIFDMIARHMPFVETEIGLNHWPNLYCGVAVYLFFLLYLSCDRSRISLREKSVYCGMLLFFFASFSVNALNFIWHGFHYPNSLPARQSFIYIFLMLFVCFRAFMNLKYIPRKHVAIAFWSSVCFMILAEKLVEQEHFHFSIYYVSILLLAMYTGLIYLYREGKQGQAVAFALALVAVEAAVNTTVTSVSITSRDAYVQDNEEVRILMDSLQPVEDFYRVEKKTRKTKNDGAWMNFPSVSLFSSTANADLTAFFKNIGCEGSTNAYSITGSTPLVDSLFSVKYALYSNEVSNTELTEYVRESGGTYLYENLYTLPLGFMVSTELEENWQYDSGNPADVQNDLCQVMDCGNVLVRTEGDTSGGTLTFTPDMTGEYYVYVTNKKVKKVEVSFAEDRKTFNNVDRGYFLELGRLAAGTTITLTTDTEGQQLNAEIYRFDEQAMIALYDKLNQNPLHLTSWMDTKLSGTVHADADGILFLSVPYDKGWKIQVDGKTVESEKMFDAFTGIRLFAGDHEITMTYFPSGLTMGLILSASAVLLLIIIYFAKKTWKRRKEEELERDSDSLI